MDETTAVKKLSGNSHHSSPPLIYIPFDMIPDTILCRLPVKSLLRFRCVCNSWDSLISKDLKFAKKHLRMSPKRQQHLVTTTTILSTETEKFSVMSCPLESLNLHSNFDDSKSSQLDYSPIISTCDDGIVEDVVASCDGILCFANTRQAILYNPSIRKLQKLPYIDIDLPREADYAYAFGYDPFIDNYKVVAVFDMHTNYDEIQVRKTHTYTLGTGSWKRIKDFPSMFPFFESYGIFMRGTVHWLTTSNSNGLKCIVSLHLGNESYQEISLPDLPHRSHYENRTELALDVMKDCLCLSEIFQERWSDFFIDIWLMKEYGNKDSWIKLISIPFFGGHAHFTDIVRI